MHSVNFLCLECERRLTREADQPARPCDHCGAPNDVVAAPTAERCSACGHDELYFQKDFNRTTGIALVVIGEVLGGWLSAGAHLPV